MYISPTTALLSRGVYSYIQLLITYAGSRSLSVYDSKPIRFLQRLIFDDSENPSHGACCAGFELEQWRCQPLANHLIEWLPEYALPEEELNVNHGNMYVKLQQAAVRVYTSPKYEKRGEAGEIALHAVCRDYFQTIPISPRVFYKSASNDVVKAFDLVHARVPAAGSIELWLGESKLYTSGDDAIKEAIKSVTAHLDQGFLTNQKLLLGPQIPKATPRYEELLELFQPQTSLDKFLSSAVFVIGIACDSAAVGATTTITESYRSALKAELLELMGKLKTAGLTGKIKILLLYVPLRSKAALVDAFDKRLKGLQ